MKALEQDLAARIAIHIIYADLDGDAEGVRALAHLACVLENDLARHVPEFDVVRWRRTWAPKSVKLPTSPQRAATIRHGIG